MNQLIVILIILKNLFKPYKADIWKLILCIIGLFLSFYVYKVYNAVQNQSIYAQWENLGCNRPLEQKLFITLDYSDIDSHKRKNFFWETDSQAVVGTSIRLFTKFSLEEDSCPSFVTGEIDDLITSQNIKSEINRLNDTLKYYNHFSAVLDYEDNNWLLPRAKTHVRWSGERGTIYNGNNQRMLNFTSVEELRPHDDSSWGFGKKKRYILFESGFGEDSLDTWINCPIIHTPHRFYEQGLLSAYDVSKLSFNVLFDVDTITAFALNFLDLVEFSEIQPSPDFQDGHMVLYTDSEKLKTLKESGFRLYVTFPKLESLQDSRNYVLSAIITLFLTLSASLLYNVLKMMHKRRKRFVTDFNRLKERHRNKSIIFGLNVLAFDALPIAVLAILVSFGSEPDLPTVSKICVALSFFVLLWYTLFTVVVRGVVKKDAVYRKRLFWVDMSVAVLFYVAIAVRIIVNVSTGRIPSASKSTLLWLSVCFIVLLIIMFYRHVRKN